MTLSLLAPSPASRTGNAPQRIRKALSAGRALALAPSQKERGEAARQHVGTPALARPEGEEAPLATGYGVSWMPRDAVQSPDGRPERFWLATCRWCACQRANVSRV